MKHTLHLITILGITAISTLHSEELAKPAIPLVDPCIGVYQHVTKLVARDPGRVVEIVTKEVAANPSCACEVVKAAIQQSKLEVKTVVAIVEAAILAAPVHMRMTAQCAIAVAPEATAEIQAVVARLDPTMGNVEHVANPLDFPAVSPDGVTPGPPLPGGPTLGGLPPFGSAPAGAGGFALIPPFIPAAINVPVTNPPVVTTVNP